MESGSERQKDERANARDEYLLARSLFAHGRYDEAKQAFLSALTVFDDYPDIHHSLGVIAHLQADFKSAVAHFQRALKLNPNYTEALLNLAITYNTVGLYENAARSFKMAAERRTGSSTTKLPMHIGARLANLHADVGSIYHDHFFYHRAIEQFQRALELCPDFVDIRLKLGMSLRDSGQLEDAVAQFRKALEIHPTYVAARVQLGFCLLKLGRQLEAKDEFEAVLASAPENMLASAGLAMIAGRGGSSQSGAEDSDGPA
jgi:tetratricopeptide (TPR) repeat protein